MGSENMGRGADAWFEELLRIAGAADIDPLLASDETLRAFLAANSMTRQEEIFSVGAIDRVKARLRGRMPAPPARPAPSMDLSGLELADMRALHRNEGELPPDIREKLDELRRKAEEEKRDHDGEEGGAPNGTGHTT